MQKRLFFLLLFLPALVFSQNLPVFPVSFYQNDSLVKNPAVGGLDLPQFSAADLNNDGILDLYIFDKLGNVQLGFLYDENAGGMNYDFDYNLTEHFPPLSEWVLLKDFNEDGIADIFGYSDVVGVDGIQVHQGFWNNGKLNFFRVEFPMSPTNLIPFMSGTDSDRIAPSKFDFPAIEDLDDDGDLDILAFGSNSSYVEFYQNQSIEMGYGLDSLIFQRADICWGKFLQDPLSAAILLSNNADECAYNSPNLNAVHTIASSLIALNLDGDLDKDLLFTNVENNEMLRLINTGNSSAEAHITGIETAFSTIPFPENPPFVPTPFHLDIDHDGQRDVVISNFVFGRESYEVGWFFKNTQTDEHPVFELQQTDFLTETMLDFGSGAHPVFVDYNGDGLQDLVVGNAQKWGENGSRTGSLHLFVNVGTPTTPIFELLDDDWLGFAADTIFHANLAPTFGDLDGDGDFDLLVGESQKKLNYFENMAGAGNEMVLNFIESHYLGFGEDSQFGTELSPQIIDVNEDGLLDLLIGERIGNLNYFQNTGTPTAPAFDVNPENAPNMSLFGGISLNFPGSSNGNTSPFLVKVEEEFKLLLGSENTGIREFGNITDNLSGDFTEITGDFSDMIKQGHFLNPAMADLDGDGFLELAIGNMRGGIAFFKTDLPQSGSVPVSETFLDNQIQVFPNPVAEDLTILFKNDLLFEKIALIDLHGRVVRIMAGLGKENKMELGGLPKGAYFLKGKNEQGTWAKKVVKW